MSRLAGKCHLGDELFLHASTGLFLVETLKCDRLPKTQLILFLVFQSLVFASLEMSTATLPFAEQFVKAHLNLPRQKQFLKCHDALELFPKLT